MRSVSVRVMLTASLASPMAARAHSPVPGIEGFYLGMLHPLSVPGQVVVLTAVGLMLGFRGFAVARPAFSAFVALLIAGTALGRIPSAEAVTGWIPLTGALISAGVLFRDAGPALAIFAGAVGGLVVGLGSMPESGPIAAVGITLAGSLAGAPFALLCVAGVAELIRERIRPLWKETISRIAGAWLIAISALLLALEWRTVGGGHG